MTKPIERVFITLKHFPLIRIELSKNIWMMYRDKLVSCFGKKFEDAEYIQDNGLFCYDFEITEEEAINISTAISKMLINPSQELRNVEINIITNN